MDLIREYDSTDEDTDDDYSKDIIEDPSKDNFLWEKLAIFTSESDHPLTTFKSFINIIRESKEDELFNQIMSHVTSENCTPMAIEEALDKNYYAIGKAVGDVKEKFWYNVYFKEGDWKCKWFSGMQCTCENCKGLIIRGRVKVNIILSLEMKNDELIQEIEASIDETHNLSLYDTLQHVMEIYEHEILDKLQEAKSRLDANDWGYNHFFNVK